MQVMWSLMARDARTEAEMTIPGRRTSWEMEVACSRPISSKHLRRSLRTYAEFTELHEPAPTAELQLDLWNLLLALLPLLGAQRSSRRVQDCPRQVSQRNLKLRVSHRISMPRPPHAPKKELGDLREESRLPARSLAYLPAPRSTQSHGPSRPPESIPCEGGSRAGGRGR